ncbi:MAG: Flp pilus assembly protein CpaB [Bacteriovoracaceae bacterium]|jgi:pilus assembly protein CpaB|nr:Flp pilus assembly protein CpaB [Bacteriovoracaceae bacterium]
MNTRAFTLSLVIAGIAMAMVYSYITSKEAEYKLKYGDKSVVVIAKQDIKELELIDDSKVTITEVPQKFVAPQALTDIKEIENTIATVPILQGEQITKPRVTYPGVKSGLSRQVSLGKRAVGVNVSASQAVSKLIKPGDRVDVMALLKYAGGRKDKMKVKTILQDVLVLSTGISMSNSIPLMGVKTPKEIKAMKLNTYTNFNTVSLEVDPYQAQKLMFLVTVGGAPIFLTLRNNDDKDIVRIKSTSLFDVLDEDAADAKSYFNSQNGGRK